LGIKNKKEILLQICKRRNLLPEEIAYIGDDSNDMDVLRFAGLTACPNDAMPFVKGIVDYITENNGGHGAFRDFCELIIFMKSK
jgi:YrbI family 3-deoxy-D-manno-octulosonate 8-phosphate phosphatase